MTQTPGPGDLPRDLWVGRGARFYHQAENPRITGVRLRAPLEVHTYIEFRQATSEPEENNRPSDRFRAREIYRGLRPDRRTRRTEAERVEARRGRRRTRGGRERENRRCHRAIEYAREPSIASTPNRMGTAGVYLRGCVGYPRNRPIEAKYVGAQPSVRNR